MKMGPPERLRTLMLIGATVLVLVAVTIVVINWDNILDWLHPAGSGK